MIPGEQRPTGGQCTAPWTEQHPTGPSIPPESKHPFSLHRVFHLGPSIYFLLV